ncbi:MAG: hypothetical protein ACOZIN_09565 [Myxococcota bacterium]
MRALWLVLPALYSGIAGAATDGGADASWALPALSAEDQELIENLELLENFETGQDLELLQELAVER